MMVLALVALVVVATDREVASVVAVLVAEALVALCQINE
jgi:hypothetical protein